MGAIEADAVAASETAPMSPGAETATSPARGTATARRGWLRRLVPRDYLHRSRRWKLSASSSSSAAASPGAGAGGAPSRLASLSRSLRWKRLPGFSLSLRSGSASAVLDTVVFRVMYVVEAVVLGLALSCFFLCCGCHL